MKSNDFEGHFLLCPYKMSYFRFGPIGSKLVLIEAICCQDYKKNSQPKNRFLLCFKGNFLIWPLTPKSFKHPYNVGSKNRFFFRLRVFSYNLETIPLRLKPVLSRSDQTGSSSFYRGKEESALQNSSILIYFIHIIHFLSWLHNKNNLLHIPRFNFKAVNTPEILQIMSWQKYWNEL